MTPGSRGRPPKKVTRMSAAIEAMAELGFQRKLIRQKVCQLLKQDVYGKEGWRFIEDDSYSVLLEALLEDQTNGVDNGNASPEQSKDGKHAETAGAGPSSSKDASPKKSCCGNDTETSGAELLSKDLYAQCEASCVNDVESSLAGPSSSKNLSPQTITRGVNDVESSLAGPSSSKVASVENDPIGGSEVEPSEPATSCCMVLFPCSNLEAVNRALQSKDDLNSATHNKTLNNSPPTVLPDANDFLLRAEVETQSQEGTRVTYSAQPVDTLPTRRRRPYYGWVGCEDDDFVVQTEAPLPEVLRKMFILNVDSGKKKRKSRWDELPEDI